MGWGAILSKKKSDIKQFDFESIVSGKTGVLKSDSEEYKIEIKGIPECTEACPAGVNVKAYVSLIANRRFEEAVEVIRQANPFPAVCGRVCTRPCEDICELATNGDSISIRALKRYASDYELSRRPLFVEPCKIIYKEKIAIIGAGPAGLSAAVDLVNLGYPVTVFEASLEPGGMLRYGIPPYRLPDRVLKREIDWIKGLGVKIETGKKINDPAILLKKGFSAVLIAGGAPKSFALGVEGEKADGVIDALQFLREINEGKPRKISGNVVVIGGGSTAFDAARSAMRLGGKKVTIVYRRGLEEIPADKEEIEAAQDEGVEIKTLAIPKKIIVKNKDVEGVEFLKAKLGEPDKSGRRVPVPIHNSEFSIKADFVITAVGAMPEVGPVGGVKVTTSKGIIEVKENGKTIVESIFAAGDVEMGASSVVEAIGRGHEAARGINDYLRGLTTSPKEELVKTLQIYLGSPVRSHAKYKPKKIEKEKLTTFEEVEESFTDFEAVEEASRCFNCGPCYACPVCLPNCKNKQLVAEIENITALVKAPLELSLDITENGPSDFKLKSDGVIKSVKLHSLTSRVDSRLCIGCGRCEEVCAYRAIKNIITKDKRSVSQVAHDSCASCSACVSECPAGAISQGYMSDSQILSRLSDKKTPYEGVKGLMSYWSTPSPLFGATDGIVELMSARKPSPLFLIRSLARTKRGLLVIKPDKATGSHYLPWEEPPSEVVEHTRNLLKLVGISPHRIQYVDLPKGKKPITLLKDFSQYLDKKNLGKLDVQIPENIKSPFGEALLLLRSLGTKPDIKPSEEFYHLPKVKARSKAYFEGCLPILHRMGEAHKLFDLGNTRLAIIEIFKRLKINAGVIEGFSCPSKILLNTNIDSKRELIAEIKERNIKAFKKADPKDLILGTPESYLSFSKEKDFGNILSLPEEILEKIKKLKDLKTVEKTIAIHHACNLDKDPYYKTTKQLLELIPGVKIVELRGKCGQSGFCDINGDSKQSAIDIMMEAERKNAEMIVCTSPYCESHLLMCSREGSWRSVDIEISDVYQVVLESIKGEI